MARLGDLFNGEQIFGVYYEASSRRRRMRGLLLKSDECLALAAWEKSKAQLDKQDAREYLNTGYEMHIHWLNGRTVINGQKIFLHEKSFFFIASIAGSGFHCLGEYEYSRRVR